MLLLAKAAAIAILVWFYTTAKKHEQNPIQWVVIGVLGFWLAWWAVKLVVLDNLVGVFAKESTMSFIMTQIPALVGIGVAYMVRKKLLADVLKRGE
jgi:hypothetical protein